MLSSILQQGPARDLEVGVLVAHVEGTGDPTTEDVVAYFKNKGLNIRTQPYPDTSDFQYRGWTRNRQLDETDADWILFADCDMVYPTDFFGVTGELLREDMYKDNPHVLHSARFSTTLDPTENLMEDFEYPEEIKDAYNLVSYLPGEVKSNIGAGFCQLVNVSLLKNSAKPYYCEPGKKIDYPYSKFHKTKSDQRFRRRLGREKIPLPLQYHMQHIRDNELGEHVEIQR
jgi:hypothetical protein